MPDRSVIVVIVYEEVELVVQTNPFLIFVFPTLVVTPVGFEDQVGTVGIWCLGISGAQMSRGRTFQLVTKKAKSASDEGADSSITVEIANDRFKPSGGELSIRVKGSFWVDALST
ncbi:hypothetical protein OSB04_028673 [Centaurea solstitialis]|uniref:Uncharacterized protein n=1 Tax=Centaurea solstitialis TaxID=347529 RepID=A0AA38VY00_9ASTR|nr:hypothetical protein OSB04_028673 [Centaurea solstitialis]